MLAATGVVSGQTASTGSGQAFPAKPVRILTASAGGANDFGARLIAQGLTPALGQQVIVENRASSSFFPGEVVSKALPDGYTLVFAASTFWIVAILQKAPYDPIKDFSPITLATQSPQVLVVHPSVAATSVRELIALAKAKPGTLNYASPGMASTNHLAGALFNAMAGTNMLHVPYQGAGPLFNDLLSGEVHVRFGTGAPVAPHIKSGRLKALAVTSAQPSALFPGVPTVTASGLPGYVMVTILGMLAPAKTPVAIINRLNQEIVRVLNSADVKEKFFGVGTEVVGNSPAEFEEYAKADTATWAKLIKEAGIKSERTP